MDFLGISSTAENYKDFQRGVGPGPRDDQCPICRIDFENDTATLTHASDERDSCQRTFCETCLLHWIDHNETSPLSSEGTICPMCRAVVVRLNDVVRLHELHAELQRLEQGLPVEEAQNAYITTYETNGEEASDDEETSEDEEASDEDEESFDEEGASHG
ncbi:MAG: hypothetical protein Q9160_002842 [Pyrenula sp. 1 TL-2023]